MALPPHLEVKRAEGGGLEVPICLLGAPNSI